MDGDLVNTLIFGAVVTFINSVFSFFTARINSKRAAKGEEDGLSLESLKKAFDGVQEELKRCQSEHTKTRAELDRVERDRIQLLRYMVRLEADLHKAGIPVPEMPDEWRKVE